MFYHFGDLVVCLETKLFGFSGRSLLATQHPQGASCLHVGPAEPFSTSLVPILSSFGSTSGKIFQPYLLTQKSRLNFAALSSSDDIMSCSDSEQGR